MNPKIYIASRYSSKKDVQQKKNELESKGFTVTSTWTEEGSECNPGVGDSTKEEGQPFAVRDIAEIDEADLLVFLSVDPTIPTVRGGRHVEFGYALGTGKMLAVVGPYENIFHYLADVTVHDTWAEFVQALEVGDYEV